MFVHPLPDIELNGRESESSICLLSPAHIVGIAGPHLCDAAEFLCAFIRATGHNSLPSTLCARCVRAGAEEQLVRVVGGNAVKEPAQSLVAFRPVAQARLGSGLDASWHVFCAELLAQVIHVASLGCIQAVIHSCHANIGVCMEVRSETSVDIRRKKLVKRMMA